MIVSKKLVLLLVLIASPAFANRNTDIFADKYFSPYSGASFMLSALSGYMALDDSIASSSYGNTSYCMTGIRSAKFLFELSLSSFAMVLQHEVFGHGYRLREFKVADVDYSIGFFSGTTFFNPTEFNALNSQKRTAVDSAGMEATGVLASQMHRKFIATSSIDRREASMYLVNALDQASYVLGTKNNDSRTSNDVVVYENNVNAWQGPNVLKLGTLKEKIVWDLLDPFLYLSVYSLASYLYNGNPYVELPTLHIGETKFLPTTRAYLTPWGVELGLKALLFTPKNEFISVGIRTGRTGTINSHAIDFHMDPIVQNGNLSIDLLLSAWKQPHLFNVPSATFNHDKYGASVLFNSYYKFNNLISALIGLGYKTSGYVPGLPLESTSLWRVGVRFSL